MTVRPLSAAALAASLAACANPPGNAGESTGSAAAPVNAAGVTTAPKEAQQLPSEPPQIVEDGSYLGKWVGPEGLVLEVTTRQGGGVNVSNQWTLDDKGEFHGSVTAEGLRFMRGGEAITAYRSSGDETGMKWLAGKKDCLTVKPGSEGYCRD